MGHAVSLIMIENIFTSVEHIKKHRDISHTVEGLHGRYGYKILS